MLEVPSVMFIIDQCCEEIDFFSIGSNDLTQYLLAVDRDNSKVTRHYNSLNPAFFCALDYAVQAVHRREMDWPVWRTGAKGSVLPLLVGLGLDELSMSAPAISATKARLARLDSRACRQLLNQAMQCRTSLEVEHLLAQFRMAQQDAPLITTQCITLNSDWRSKEEVLKGMTDNLLLAGGAATRVSWRPISGRAKRYFPPGWASALLSRTASRSILSSRPSAWLAWHGRWRGR